MDILGGLRNDYLTKQEAIGSSPARPRTIIETISDQIAYHERKLTDLKAAQEILKNSEIMKALEALQKLSW